MGIHIVEAAGGACGGERIEFKLFLSLPLFLPFFFHQHTHSMTISVSPHLH